MSGPPVWLDPEEVAAAVARLAVEANTRIGPDVLDAFRAALQREESPAGREVLAQLLENAALADASGVPYCQDTGMVVVFARLGGRVLLTAGTLQAAVDGGVRRAYTEHLLRKSVIGDPLRRRNTGDNTPAVLHLEHVAGDEADRLTLDVMPKGFGGENMSVLRMLPPSAGWEGVERCVVETVAAAGPNACPPLVVGVGVGSDFEGAPLLAKRALLRPVGAPHPDAAVAAYEARLRAAVDATGIGPQGLGGSTTAVAVHLELGATHIAALPVAVNLGCNAYRHRSAVLRGHPDPTRAAAAAAALPRTPPVVAGAGPVAPHSPGDPAATPALAVDLPISEAQARAMRPGQAVRLSGPIYGMRDAAHARLHALLREGREAELPIDLRGAAVYYVGPAPPPPGQAVGAAGPTTSERMDAYTPALIERGLRLMVGKGRRSPEVKAAMRRHGAVYLVATGGAAALLGRHILRSEVIAYPDLGTEAIHLMTLRDFPCRVVVDARGADLYETGPRAYARA